MKHVLPLCVALVVLPFFTGKADATDVSSYDTRIFEQLPYSSLSFEARKGRVVETTSSSKSETTGAAETLQLMVKSLDSSVSEAASASSSDGAAESDTMKEEPGECMLTTDGVVCKENRETPEVSNTLKSTPRNQQEPPDFQKAGKFLKGLMDAVGNASQ